MPSFAELLLVLAALGLPPEVGFAGALPGFAEGVLDGLGGGLAAFALEAFGLDGDFAGGETRTWMRRLTANLLPG